jgi:hypothetical protein
MSHRPAESPTDASDADGVEERLEDIVRGGVPSYLSEQLSRRSRPSGPRSRASANHVTNAQMAPPDVPPSPATSNGQDDSYVDVVLESGRRTGLGTDALSVRSPRSRATCPFDTVFLYTSTVSVANDYVVEERSSGMATNWRAVLVGFLVMVVVGSFGGIVIPLFGTVGGGVVGGFIAGYIAGGGIWNGTWNGLVAGAFGGIVGALILSLVGALVGALAGPLGSVLTGASVFVLGAAVALLFAVPSGAAGALGGWLKGPARDRSADSPQTTVR